LTDENGLRHFDRELDLFVLLQLLFIGVGEELQGLVVKVFVIVLHRVELCLHTVEERVDTLVPVALNIQLRTHFIQHGVGLGQIVGFYFVESLF
jgi:hypothetical protein